VLETGDVSRDARLGEVNPVGGPSESPRIYDLEPGAEPGQFKIHDVTLRRMLPASLDEGRSSVPQTFLDLAMHAMMPARLLEGLTVTIWLRRTRPG
jgi:hypothetical protein